MRIVLNSPDLLIVRDRAVLPVLALLAIAVIMGTLGLLGALTSDDQAMRLVGAGCVVVALPLVGFALFIAREHTHTFDRRQGVVLRRVRHLIGPQEQMKIPLDRVLGVEIIVEEDVADPDTYAVALVVAPHQGEAPRQLRLRNYTSSDDPRPIYEVVERWLAGP